MISIKFQENFEDGKLVKSEFQIIHTRKMHGDYSSMDFLHLNKKDMVDLWNEMKKQNIDNWPEKTISQP